MCTIKKKYHYLNYYTLNELKIDEFRYYINLDINS